MLKSGITAFLIVLALSFEVCAQHVTSFAGIPFGSTREHVIEEVMKLGYEPYGRSGEGERVVIPVYMLADLPVQVDFIFNKNDKFYAFEIRTGRVERARLSKSFEAVGYMSEQFTLKYGQSSQEATLKESDLREGIHNLYQQWFSVKALDIYTAIVQKDGRYFAIGTVTHRNLAKEAVQTRKPREKASAIPAF